MQQQQQSPVLIAWKVSTSLNEQHTYTVLLAPVRLSRWLRHSHFIYFSFLLQRAPLLDVPGRLDAVSHLHYHAFVELDVAVAVLMLCAIVI